MIGHAGVKRPVVLQRIAVLALITAVAMTLVGASTVLAVAPANDTFQWAEVLDGIPASEEISTVEATSAGEPAPSCQSSFGHTVWYRLRPSTGFTITAETEGSDYDTVLAVYRATGSGLTEVACDDDGGLGSTSLVTFPAVGGSIYYFQVGGSSTNAGSLSLEVTGRPANDRFQKARVVGSLPFFHEIDQSEGAGIQAGEPTPSCVLGINATVWYRYSPGSDRRVTADTFDSEFDTFIAVWRGTSLGTLTQVRCNDNAQDGEQSQVGWLARAGRTYYVQVGGMVEGGDLGVALTRVP